MGAVKKDSQKIGQDVQQSAKELPAQAGKEFKKTGSALKKTGKESKEGEIPPPASAKPRENSPCRHYPLVNLEAMAATCFPWKRAAASSFSLGIRSPFPPAMVDAP